MEHLYFHCHGCVCASARVCTCACCGIVVYLFSPSLGILFQGQIAPGISRAVVLLPTNYTLLGLSLGSRVPVLPMPCSGNQVKNVVLMPDRVYLYMTALHCTYTCTTPARATHAHSFTYMSCTSSLRTQHAAR